MLSTPENFFKNFLWKNIDISINKAEHLYILDNAVESTIWMELFNKFKYSFDDDILKHYILILSNIDDIVLEKFLVFYIINCFKYNKGTIDKIFLKNYEMLEEFIGNDEEKFRMFIISIHFYF